MKYIYYFAIVTKDEKHGYDVSFPDFPGVGALSSILEEAKWYAVEDFHYQIRDKNELPKPTNPPHKENEINRFLVEIEIWPKKPPHKENEINRFLVEIEI